MSQQELVYITSSFFVPNLEGGTELNSEIIAITNQLLFLEGIEIEINHN